MSVSVSLFAFLEMDREVDTLGVFLFCSDFSPNACVHLHICAHTYACMRVCAHTHIHTPTHTHIHACTNINTHTNTTNTNLPQTNENVEKQKAEGEKPYQNDVGLSIAGDALFDSCPQLMRYFILRHADSVLQHHKSVDTCTVIDFDWCAHIHHYDQCCTQR